MFKGFKQVYKFTFLNYLKNKSYIAVTLIIMILALALPGVISYLVNTFDDKETPPNTAEKVYVVNEITDKDIDYSILNMLSLPEGFVKPEYVPASSVEEAIDTADDAGDKSLILQIYELDESVSAKVIIPENSTATKDDASSIKDILNENSPVFLFLATGRDISDLAKLSAGVSTGTFTADNYVKGITDDDAVDMNNSDIKGTINMVVVMVTAFLIYFFCLMYGNSIANSMIMEKQSKLMDMMLVSVKPESMILGKYLGIFSAALLQVGLIIAGLFGGLFIMMQTTMKDKADMINGILTAVTSAGMLKIAGIILAIVCLIVGCAFYCSISTIGGSISSSREGLAKNQAIFILTLVASFYVVFFGGMATQMKDFPVILQLIPPVSAFLTPGSLLTGVIPPYVGIISIIISLVAIALINFIAGKLYKMASLYKGEELTLKTAFKRLKKQ
ncbi:MAG: ABC transporter permease [Lachnospiraceae bacterium]|nr:ABC transporter permease [Lachnospiraceae bacterium]